MLDPCRQTRPPPAVSVAPEKTTAVQEGSAASSGGLCTSCLASRGLSVFIHPWGDAPEVGAPEAHPETRTQEQVLYLGRFPEAPGGSQEVRQERGGGQSWMGQGAGDPLWAIGGPYGDLVRGCRLQPVGPGQPASCFCKESSHRVHTQALSCVCCLWPFL